MRYYVRGVDGKQYGPADLDMLNQWAIEGRVLPNQMVEEESSGRRYEAALVPGIRFSPGQAFNAPSPMYTAGRSSYMPPVPDSNTQKDLTTAWILGAVQFVCPCFPISAIGLWMAIVVQRKGDDRAKGAVVFCAVMLAFYLLWHFGGSHFLPRWLDIPSF